VEFLNRVVKLNGNRKMYEIGFCEAEILYIRQILKNKLTIKFTTTDPAQYPIHIFGVDIFGKLKETIDFDLKLDKLRAVCMREDEKEREKGINDVMLEMMQSENIPPLVTWKEMFSSIQDLLADCKDKEIRDEKLLLFNLSEASTYVTQFMTDQQIENDLMYYIHPLIGEYL
jgi:hypothetical protein